MFKRDLDTSIRLVEAAFSKALTFERCGMTKDAEFWLAKAIEIEARAFA